MDSLSILYGLFASSGLEVIYDIAMSLMIPLNLLTCILDITKSKVYPYIYPPPNTRILEFLTHISPLLILQISLFFCFVFKPPKLVVIFTVNSYLDYPLFVNVFAYHNFLNPIPSFCISYPSCRKHIVGSYVCVFLILYDNLCLLMSILRPFTSKTTISVAGLIAIVFVTGFNSLS